MKSYLITLVLLLLSTFVCGQESKGVIYISSEETINNSDILRLLNFERIDFLKLSFKGRDLANKSYHITVKEIWDGVVKSESDIINSAKSPLKEYKYVNDSVLSIDIIAKPMMNNKIKMSFKFPGVIIEKKFDGINSDNYSLRNLSDNELFKAIVGEKFYLLAYILPYEKNGVLSWCAVENSGGNVLNWGKEFGIKHYLVFEMKFE